MKSLRDWRKSETSGRRHKPYEYTHEAPGGVYYIQPLEFHGWTVMYNHFEPNAHGRHWTTISTSVQTVRDGIAVAVKHEENR